MNPVIPTIAEIEAEWGVPASEWHGRCAEAAHHCAEVIKAKGGEAREARGQYLGECHPDGYWGGRGPFNQHSWVVLGTDTIVDPTRFSLENYDPYVFVLEPCGCDDFAPEDSLSPICDVCGHVDEEHERGGFFEPCKMNGTEYDEGGNKVRQALAGNRRVPSPPAEGEDTWDCDFGEATEIVRGLLEGADGPYGRAQLMFLANLDPREAFEGRAKAVYDGIVNGCKFGSAFIPMDNYDNVMKGVWT